MYSISGASTEYPNFVEVTGYGTVIGLHGVNCRHSFHPFYKGISEAAYTQAELDSYADKTVIYNGKEMSVYEATQYQRGVERKIRHWKRQAGALEAAGQDNTFERLKMGEWQAEMRKFVKETGLIRQREREQVPAFVSSESVDRDLRLAQEGKLFDLQSLEKEVVYNKPMNLSSRYNDDRLKAQNITFEKGEKGHVWWEHPNDREWLSKNQDLVLKAIVEPLYVDMIPRKGKRREFNIAHIVYIGEKDFPYLNVVINFRTGKAKIQTMYRAGGGFVFKNGLLQSRWKKAT
ncbi:MAG: hypothetical protein IT308_12370 [Anaerolineaceae bacterium]|nr:hypothetical protein [Anaerolineaceae bacterium]